VFWQWVLSANARIRETDSRDADVPSRMANAVSSCMLASARMSATELEGDFPFMLKLLFTSGWQACWAIKMICIFQTGPALVASIAAGRSRVNGSIGRKTILAKIWTAAYPAFDQSGRGASDSPATAREGPGFTPGYSRWTFRPGSNGYFTVG
jgi:hypothetical protein